MCKRMVIVVSKERRCWLTISILEDHAGDKDSDYLRIKFKELFKRLKHAQAQRISHFEYAILTFEVSVYNGQAEKSIFLERAV